MCKTSRIVEGPSARLIDERKGTEKEVYFTTEVNEKDGSYLGTVTGLIKSVEDAGAGALKIVFEVTTIAGDTAHCEEPFTTYYNPNKRDGMFFYKSI